MEALWEAEHYRERPTSAPQTPEQSQLIADVESLYTQSDIEVVRLLSKFLFNNEEES